jgi:hypothetical protein
VLDFGDGWLPQCGPLASVEELAQRARVLRVRAADAGRERVPITLFGAIPDAGLLEEFAAAGVNRCLLLIKPQSPSQTLAELDQLAALIGPAAAPPERQ